MDFSIRPMRHEDIPQVTQIEREAFPTSWPPTPFRRELGNKMARYLVAWAEMDGSDPSALSLQGTESPLVTPAPWLQRVIDSVKSLFGAPPDVLATDRDLVAGYVGMWFVLEEAHITTIAVREGLRRMGLGELLIVAAMELAIARRLQRVTLEARISNLPAHSLYEKYGFKKVGTRRGYYSDNNEDAYVMTVDSILSPSYQQKFQELVDGFNHRRGEAVRILA